MRGNGLLFALLIAIVDALPIFGVGSVLIPLGIIGVYIIKLPARVVSSALVCYCPVIRQLIEPKIVGQQIGFTAAYTVFHVLGLQLFGFFGMILGPVLVVIAKSILGAVVKTDGFKNWLQRTFGPIPRTGASKRESVPKS